MLKLRIEVYFHEIEEIIEATASVQLSNITFEKRGTHEGFIRGELHFIDGSTLHLREFVDVELTKDRFMYVYQYLDPRGKLVFRYDNTGHHKKLGLSTYPHHKHTVSKDRVFTSNAPELADVLKEIESHIVFS